jgi:epoxide hydrolase-like predicted phosphatase
MTLKAVIFDVGGVFIRTHSRLGREKWAARFKLDPWEFEDFVFSGESGRQAQVGQKTSAAHWRWLGDYFSLAEPDVVELQRDFFAGDSFNESLLEQVIRLRQAGYQTSLLSNFWDSARQFWAEIYPFVENFDDIVISAEVGLMKPDPQIYYLAARRLGILPAEALFVDDSAENIAGARAAGMQVLHFSEPEAGQRELTRITGVA